MLQRQTEMLHPLNNLKHYRWKDKEGKIPGKKEWRENQQVGHQNGINNCPASPLHRFQSTYHYLSLSLPLSLSFSCSPSLSLFPKENFYTRFTKYIFIFLRELVKRRII